MGQIITKIKRGSFEGTVTQEQNKYFLSVTQAGKHMKDAGPYFDQDEAEVELGTLIDTVWREISSTKGKLVRRV